jgi:CsoR family transcriptional regulator, copper-sensing transcriptional repressor
VTENDPEGRKDIMDEETVDGLSKSMGEENGEHPHRHEHYQSVVSRLARIEGHVRAVKRMVENDTPCPDVLVQVAAVRAALNSVGKLILEDHLQSCMVAAVENGDFHEAMRDLKNSLDKFIN